jgi:hypothetical protein
VIHLLLHAKGAMLSKRWGTAMLPFQPRDQSWPLVMAAALVRPTLKSVTSANVETAIDGDDRVAHRRCKTSG